MKRATYKTQLTLATADGFLPVYLDESGFTAETVRHHGYAPRGTPVSDLRSSQQYRSTSLIAARLNGDFVTSLYGELQHLSLRGVATLNVSMNGFRRRYAHI